MQPQQIMGNSKIFKNMFHLVSTTTTLEDLGIWTHGRTDVPILFDPLGFFLALCCVFQAPTLF